MPSEQSSLILGIHSRTAAKLCKSHSIEWKDPLDVVSFNFSNEFLALSEGLFKRTTFAPSLPHASAAVYPVPEVVPVMTMVLPTRGGRLSKSSSKYFDSRLGFLYPSFVVN